MPEHLPPEVYGELTGLNFEVSSKSLDLAFVLHFAVDEEPQDPAALEAKPRPLHFDIASVVARAPVTI